MKPLKISLPLGFPSIDIFLTFAAIVTYFIEEYPLLVSDFIEKFDDQKFEGVTHGKLTANFNTEILDQMMKKISKGLMEENK
jgi:hypothetical protein